MWANWLDTESTARRRKTSSKRGTPLASTLSEFRPICSANLLSPDYGRVARQNEAAGAADAAAWVMLAAVIFGSGKSRNAEAKLGTRNTERTAKHGDRSRRQVVLCSMLT